jgi:hypothetical protein
MDHLQKEPPLNLACREDPPQISGDGHRDPGRLYEQVLKAYGIDDTSMLLVSAHANPLTEVRKRSAQGPPLPDELVNFEQTACSKRT